MKLREEIRQTLIEDYNIRSKIGLLTEKHPATVYRWVLINANHGPLTGWSVLSLLSSELGITPGGLITEEEPYSPTTFMR